MKKSRHPIFLVAITFVALVVAIISPSAHAGQLTQADVLKNWYGLVLKLVRHTPTYSPPVASRAFAYLGVTAYEATATGSPELQSLAGQLNGLKPIPEREIGKQYDDVIVLNSAMSSAVASFFGNTGPTGQRVLSLLTKKMRTDVTNAKTAELIARSEAYGQMIADHVLQWSKEDGGAVVENMGFPLSYKMGGGPARWVPTSLIVQQQVPLLPKWGNNRTFALPNGTSCNLPPPPDYSEEKGSAFYNEAIEVYETQKNLTEEQRKIARFWSDDPMLSPTPPGHWLAIALQIIERDKLEIDKSVDVLARLGIAVADSFIACWQTKFQYDLLRPVTYIRRLVDPKWESLLITPPFPEYPSGHSTQSGAAATILTQAFGEHFAFQDATHERDGLGTRSFPDFWTAASEAAISRLYGGIHFRSAIERGLEQGRCIGKFANSLRTRK